MLSPKKFVEGGKFFADSYIVLHDPEENDYVKGLLEDMLEDVVLHV